MQPRQARVDPRSIDGERSNSRDIGKFPENSLFVRGKPERERGGEGGERGEKALESGRNGEWAWTMFTRWPVRL